MEVLLIRHGDPDYANHTLTDLGHTEAKLLAQSLRDIPITSIHVSPLGRAIDTMRYTAQVKNLSHTVHEWLKEVSAAGVDGLAAWELPPTHILGKETLPTVENWQGETTFGSAFVPFYESISHGFDEVMKEQGYDKTGNLYRVERSSDELLAFFCHKGTILTLLSYLLHWPLPILFAHCDIRTSSVTRLLWKETDNGWATPVLQEINDVSHL